MQWNTFTCKLDDGLESVNYQAGRLVYPVHVVSEYRLPVETENNVEMTVYYVLHISNNLLPLSCFTALQT